MIIIIMKYEFSLFESAKDGMAFHGCSKLGQEAQVFVPL